MYYIKSSFKLSDLETIILSFYNIYYNYLHKLFDFYIRFYNILSYTSDYSKHPSY